MKMSKKFVAFEALNPVAAKKLPPGMKLQVSRLTFAQIAVKKFNALGAAEVTCVASSAPSINSAQAKIVRAAAMAASVGESAK